MLDPLEIAISNEQDDMKQYIVILRWSIFQMSDRKEQKKRTICFRNKMRLSSFMCGTKHDTHS